MTRAGEPPDSVFSAELAVLGVLAAARIAVPSDDVGRVLERAGIGGSDGRRAIASLRSRGLVHVRDAGSAPLTVELTQEGIRHFLELHATIEQALDPSPKSAIEEDCPSIPWLTTVQTTWIDAVSFNFAVDARSLASLLPAPLEPEIHRGSAWVQILMSSLRDMRPQGLGALFGVSFYQVSYRAAVRYRRDDGSWRRGGYFVRSETNHPVMRTVGNALTEFKFHHFGAAEMVMVRDGDRLTLGIDPHLAHPNGKLVALLDTQPLSCPPTGSVWRSVEELHEPLVECYDALGVDREAGWLYLLTIDRDPWNPRFVAPLEIYSEYFDTGPLGGGVARLDSVLHFRECAYRWRPLRREPLPGRTSPALSR